MCYWTVMHGFDALTKMKRVAGPLIALLVSASIANAINSIQLISSFLAGARDCILRIFHGYESSFSFTLSPSWLSSPSLCISRVCFFSQIRPTSVDLNFLDHSFHIKTLMDLNQIFTLARLINIFSASGDSAITISLIYLLRRSIGGLSGSKSETLINRIILYTMGSGLITSICAIMAMVMVCAILTFYGFTMDQWCCGSNGTK